MLGLVEKAGATNKYRQNQKKSKISTAQLTAFSLGRKGGTI